MFRGVTSPNGYRCLENSLRAASPLVGRQHLGQGPAGGLGRRRLRRPGRLVDGRRRLDLLPDPSVRGRRTQGRTADPARRPTPRNHRPDVGLGRLRGGPTSRIYRITWRVEGAQMIEAPDRIGVPRPAGGRPRTRPDHVSGDKAYSSCRNRRYLRRRQIKHMIPRVQGPARRPPTPRQPGRQTHRLRPRAPPPPPRRRNKVERTTDPLKTRPPVPSRPRTTGGPTPSTARSPSPQSGSGSAGDPP